MHFKLLAEHPAAVPIIANWYFTQWGHLSAESSLEETSAALDEAKNRDRLPLILLAIEDEEVLGAAELKPHEMLSLFPDKEPWLGGVYVRADVRGRGIATQLAEGIVEIAKSFGAKQLFLQTEQLDGGLYARLGWNAVQQVTDRGHTVLVMERHL